MSIRRMFLGCRTSGTTAKSFAHHNPDWKIKVWYPKVVGAGNLAHWYEQKGEFNGPDYIDQLEDIPGVEAHAFDRVVVAISPLPEALASASNALPLEGPHTAEPRGPGVWTARPYFDDRHDGSLASDDVELEVTDAQVASIKAETDYVQAQYDYQLAVAKLEMAMGVIRME